MDTLARVSIDHGCICCLACISIAPDVFAFPDGHAVVLGEVRVDCHTSRNADERSPLNAVGLEYEDLIAEAAAACPVEIIHFERGANTVQGP